MSRRRIGAIAALLIVAWGSVSFTNAYLKARSRDKLRDTYRTMDRLGWSIDASRRACIQQQRLTQRDGYGRHLVFLSSPARYVLVSYGSDGKPDALFTSHVFFDFDSDTVVSNGDWIHGYAGFARRNSYPPRVPDAIAEASSCTHPPLPPCPSYLYAQSEAEARAIAAKASAGGFRTEVRKSRTGEWLCLASKAAEDCETTYTEIFKLTVSER